MKQRKWDQEKEKTALLNGLTLIMNGKIETRQFYKLQRYSKKIKGRIKVGDRKKHRVELNDLIWKERG